MKCCLLVCVLRRLRNFFSFVASRGFVKISAALSSVGQYLWLRHSFSSESSGKWYLVSLCIDNLLDYSFWVSLWQHWLALYITTDGLKNILKSFSILTNDTTSYAVSANATYSGSVDSSTTVYYSFMVCSSIEFEDIAAIWFSIESSPA